MLRAVFPLALAVTTVSAQTTDSLPLFDNLGTLHRAISTSSATTQAYFDQGLRLLYGFDHPNAERSFRRALASDSTCGICYWGIAISHAPYINATMDSASGVTAFEAMTQAQRLARHENEWERAFIEAQSARFERVPTDANRARLDSAYARAMQRVSERFPDDLDAAALYAEAMMVLRPWDHWTADGQPQPGTDAIVSTLESVLSRDVTHPGACHFYIHATEASRHPERAERCANLLASVIPGTSHLVHMPGHTYMRTGRYGDAVRTNQEAVMVDHEAQHGRATAVYTTHNYHFLFSAAMMDGQSAVAIQAARDIIARSQSPYFGSVLVFALARFGRWSDIIRLPRPEVPFVAGMWQYGNGLAHLRMGHVDVAARWLDSLDATRESVGEEATVGSHSARTLLSIAANVLGGEILAARGDIDEAVRRLELAVRDEDALVYDEPRPWYQPVRQNLGAVLLEAGRLQEAEQVYRRDLIRNPENGWSLMGLALTLDAAGRPGEARIVRERFERAWERADVRLSRSAF